LPLTGEFASYGEGVRRGIELFLESTPGKFDFHFEDDGCEAKRAVGGFEKLASAGVKLFIVGCLSGVKAILPLTKRHDALLLSVGLVDDQTFTQTSRLINLATQLSVESRYLADRVANRGFRRPAIIHWQDPFSNEFAETLAKELSARGATIVAMEGVDPKDSDYRALLTRIKKLNPDSICFNIGENQSAILLRQIRDLQIEVPIFSNYVIETSKALSLGSLGTKVEYSFPMNASENSVEKTLMDQRFTARFGKDASPTPNFYFVIDGLNLLVQALVKCGNEDLECIANYFKSSTHYRGLSGDITFRPDGSIERPYGIKKIAGNQFVWVTKTE